MIGCISKKKSACIAMKGLCERSTAYIAAQKGGWDTAMAGKATKLDGKLMTPRKSTTFFSDQLPPV